MSDKKIVTEEEQYEIIKTKQSLFWHFAYLYIKMLEEYDTLMDDKGFYKVYQDMQRYIEKKLDLEDGGDVIDMYVTVEQAKGAIAKPRFLDE